MQLQNRIVHLSDIHISHHILLFLMFEEPISGRTVCYKTLVLIFHILVNVQGGGCGKYSRNIAKLVKQWSLWDKDYCVVRTVVQWLRAVGVTLMCESTCPAAITLETANGHMPHPASSPSGFPVRLASQQV